MIPCHHHLTVQGPGAFPAALLCFSAAQQPAMAELVRWSNPQVVVVEVAGVIAVDCHLQYRKSTQPSTLLGISKQAAARPGAVRCLACSRMTPTIVRRDPGRKRWILMLQARVGLGLVVVLRHGQRTLQSLQKIWMVRLGGEPQCRLTSLLLKTTSIWTMLDPRGKTKIMLSARLISIIECAVLRFLTLVLGNSKRGLRIRLDLCLQPRVSSGICFRGRPRRRARGSKWCVAPGHLHRVFWERARSSMNRTEMSQRRGQDQQIKRPTTRHIVIRMHQSITTTTTTDQTKCLGYLQSTLAVESNFPAAWARRIAPTPHQQSSPDTTPPASPRYPPQVPLAPWQKPPPTNRETPTIRTTKHTYPQPHPHNSNRQQAQAGSRSARPVLRHGIETSPWLRRRLRSQPRPVVASVMTPTAACDRAWNARRVWGMSPRIEHRITSTKRVRITCLLRRVPLSWSMMYTPIPRVELSSFSPCHVEVTNLLNFNLGLLSSVQE